jgi:hypothetical protein
MGWKDKIAAGFFVVCVVASLTTVVYITALSRDERAASAAERAAGGESTESALIRGIVLDFGRAIQRGDPESACVLMTGDAFATFDCRFGRTAVPDALAIPEDAPLSVRDVVIQGDDALAELRGGATPQPVRLHRTSRRWRIVRVGLPPR